MHINSRFQHIYRNVSYRSNFERSYLGLNQFLPPNVLVLVEKKTLGQALKTFRTSSKALLLLPSLSLKSLVVLIKKFFIIVANCFSFVTRLPFSLRKSLFEFDPLLLKYG